MFSSLSGRIRLALFVALLAAAPAHARLAEACFNFLKAQDYPRAESEALSQLKLYALAREDEWALQHCLGRARVATGRFRDALPALERVEALSRSTMELWVAYNWLGSAFGQLGDLDRAELYTQRELKVAKSMGDKSREANTLNNMADIAEKRGDQTRALTLYRESLALQPNEAKKPATLNNIALIHSARGENAEATLLLRQVIEIFRRQGDSHSVAMSQLNLGNTMRLLGDQSGAARELTSGLKTIQTLGDRNWEAAACKFLAWLAEDRQDLPAAMDWYSKAEKIYREIGQTQKANDIHNAMKKLN